MLKVFSLYCLMVTEFLLFLFILVFPSYLWYSYIHGASHSLSYLRIGSVNQFSGSRKSFPIFKPVTFLHITLLFYFVFFNCNFRAFQEVLEVNAFVSSVMLNWKSFNNFFFCTLHLRIILSL